MKIAFDEHVPDGLYRVFDTLSAERKMRKLIGATGRGRAGGYTIVRSREYNPSPDDEDYLAGQPGSDVPWMTKFAEDEGSVIISGNVEMMSVPQEALAIQNTGLVAFYFETGWNEWNFFKNSSLLLWHWELIVKTICDAKPGDIYRIPAAFRESKALNLVLRAGQMQLLEDSPRATGADLKKARKKLTRRSRDQAGKGDGQGQLRLSGKN